MDDARHGGAGPGAEVGLFYQQDIDALQRQLGQQTDAVDAPANYQDGDIGVISKRGEFWAHPISGGN